MENTNLEIRSLDTQIFAEGLKITNDDQYVGAIEYGKTLKSLEDEIGMAYDDAIASAFKTHRTLTATKKRYIEPVAKARSIINAKCLEYKKRREDEERKAQAIAQEVAEKRARELLGNPEACMVDGEQGQDQALSIETGAPLVVPTVQAVPEVEGFSTRKDWSFVIEDASKIPDEYKVIDEKKIRAVVKALKDQCKIPGVRVFEKEIPINRS